MLAKLNIVKEKDLAALKSELVGSDVNEDIDVRISMCRKVLTNYLNSVISHRMIADLYAN